MKKNLLFALLLLLSAFGQAQNFGFYASAVRLTVNSDISYYDTDDTTDANRVGNLHFSGGVPYYTYSNFDTSLGVFAQNSGALLIDGGIIKTYKNSNSNVCGTTLYYTVYPQNNRPASPVFTPINFNFLDNCLGNTFPLDGSACSSGDQQWGDTATVAGTDLTNDTLGDYTLEIYYQVPGAFNSTSNCSDTVYDNNNNPLLNYKASFTISSVVPLTLLNFSGAYDNKAVMLNWSVANVANEKVFAIERGTDGKNFALLSLVDAKQSSSSNASYSYKDNNLPQAAKVFYRLKMISNSGAFSYSPVITEKIGAAKSAILSAQLMPANLDIELGAAIGDNSVVKIIGLEGKTILEKNINAHASASFITIPLSHALSGAYILSIYDGASGSINSIKIRSSN